MSTPALARASYAYVTHQASRRRLSEPIAQEASAAAISLRTTHERDPRIERQIVIAGRLLPASIRDRHVGEWLDHVRCECEAGGDPQRAARSILLHSVVPIVTRARLRRLPRGPARPR
jgi:hypothetical protein